MIIPDDVSRWSSLNGICPKVQADGKIGDTQWFDIGRIEIVGVGVGPKEVQSAEPGGVNRDSPR